MEKTKIGNKEFCFTIQTIEEAIECGRASGKIYKKGVDEPVEDPNYICVG
ncbi:MAG: hypothetical protein ACRC4M_02670 [Mycoplasma sp.]